MKDLPKWSRDFLTNEAFHKIENAVAAAELRTAGEIVPIVVRRSSTLGHVSAIVFLGLGLLSSPGVYWLTFFAHDLWITLAGLVCVAAVLMLGVFMTKSTRIQRLLVTAEDRQAQVMQRAQLEFYHFGLNTTRDATGILLFVSLLERQVVVLADKAIAEKLPPNTWAEVRDRLIEGIRHGDLASGFASGIEECGRILAEHFPIRSDDTNELANHFVIKE